MPRDAFGKNKKWTQHRNRQIGDITEEKLLDAMNYAKPNKQTDNVSDHEEEKKESGSDNDNQIKFQNDSDDDSDEDNIKYKGVSGLIEVQNPNRMKKSGNAPIEISRRVKEELQEEKKKRKDQADLKEGKSETAKTELERLAEIRKKREEAARERQLETKKTEEAKKKAQKQSVEQFNTC